MQEEHRGNLRASLCFAVTRLLGRTTLLAEKGRVETLSTWTAFSDKVTGIYDCLRKVSLDLPSPRYRRVLGRRSFTRLQQRRRNRGARRHDRASGSGPLLSQQPWGCLAYSGWPGRSDCGRPGLESKPVGGGLLTFPASSAAGSDGCFAHPASKKHEMQIEATRMVSFFIAMLRWKRLR